MPLRRRLWGIRGRIPQGFFLGRLSPGEGDVELLTSDEVTGSAGLNVPTLPVDLETEVTGTLPIASGGTGGATAGDARTALGVDVAGTDNSTDVTLAGTPGYITIVGQVITRLLIDLGAVVTGVLPIANGGTNASTASGARTELGLGTAAVKNTGTSGDAVPLLDQANTFGATQNMQDLIPATDATFDLGSSTKKWTEELVGDGRYRYLVLVIADDDFTTIPVQAGRDGWVFASRAFEGSQAIIHYDTAGTDAIGIHSDGGNAEWEVTTGPLTGTTGTDGKATMSIHSDNLLYIENRISVQITFRIRVWD